MDIVYKDQALEKLCLQAKVAQKKLGTAGAKKLRSRWADLDAATRVQDLVAGEPQPLKGDRKHQFRIKLAGGLRLVFEANEDPPPRNCDGSIDWPNVTSVRIVFIGDYHD